MWFMTEDRRLRRLYAKFLKTNSHKGGQELLEFLITCGDTLQWPEDQVPKLVQSGLSHFNATYANQPTPDSAVNKAFLRNLELLPRYCVNQPWSAPAAVVVARIKALAETRMIIESSLELAVEFCLENEQVDAGHLYLLAKQLSGHLPRTLTLQELERFRSNILRRPGEKFVYLIEQIDSEWSKLRRRTAA